VDGAGGWWVGAGGGVFLEQIAELISRNFGVRRQEVDADDLAGLGALRVANVRYEPSGLHASDPALVLAESSRRVPHPR